jgi:hypothetical protein
VENCPALRAGSLALDVDATDAHLALGLLPRGFSTTVRASRFKRRPARPARCRTSSTRWRQARWGK